MDIIITIPQKIDWLEYEEELDAVEDGSGVLRFKIQSFPQHADRGDRCYLVWRGAVRGWMEIVGFWEGDFECQTTGRRWSGKFIERSGPFHQISRIPMRGFQGYRYAPAHWNPASTGKAT